MATSNTSISDQVGFLTRQELSSTVEAREANEKPRSEDDMPFTVYLQGWTLHSLFVAFVVQSYLLELVQLTEHIRMCLALFIATTEISIVSTVLVSITNGLGDFADGSWIITAYLLTCTS